MTMIFKKVLNSDLTKKQTELSSGAGISGYRKGLHDFSKEGQILRAQGGSVLFQLVDDQKTLVLKVVENVKRKSSLW
jgi:hypothetical protein